MRKLILLASLLALFVAHQVYSQQAGVFPRIVTTEPSSHSATIAGGIVAGVTRNQIVDYSGRIPALTTQYFSSLDASALQNISTTALVGRTICADVPSNLQVLTWITTESCWKPQAVLGNHNLLSASHPDTTAASPVLGDLIATNNTPAWQKVAGNTTSAKQFLTQTGTGAVSALPVWAAILDADVPNTITLDNLTQVTTRSHASLQDLLADDHTQYLLASGARALSGDLTLTKQDPSIILNAGQAGDTKFWSGVIDNNDGVDNDTYQIGTGIIPGTGTQVAISGLGAITANSFIVSGGVSIGSNVVLPSAGLISWSDLFLQRDAANVLACRNGVNPCTARFYATFTDILNRENFAIIPTIGAGFELKAETAGTGADNLGIILTPAGAGGLTLTSGHFLFTDNVSDIGAPGATRPKDIYISGRIAQNRKEAIVVDAVTTFAVTSGYISLACTGAETINTIAGGATGLELVIEHTDTECTIADDDDPTAANAVNLTGTATNDAGAVGKVIRLLYDGTHWLQVGESANG